jgi:hypothetical protein
VVSRILVSVAVAVVAAVVIAQPASADPNLFRDLDCSCPQTFLDGSPAFINQVTRGIQQGQSDVQAFRGQQ